MKIGILVIKLNVNIIKAKGGIFEYFRSWIFNKKEYNIIIS